MQIRIGQSVVELRQGDITLETVDAIVNAANSRLMGGGGVDGAIHRRGGPKIMAETNQKYPDGCATGSAVISTAGELPAKFVIHAVGPIWQNGRHGESEQLAGAYRRSLQLAVEHDCRSIAFPALSSGAYRYPMEAAADVAISTTLEFLREQGRPELVRFVLFSEGAYQVFSAALKKHADFVPQANG
jgi:O-acetyl-ADP-ribose deacetylase (regulator of RNase III)